jgi:lysophospholipase L1-like esterase
MNTMAQSDKRSRLSEVRNTAILVVVMLILFEMISSIVHNYRQGGNQFAIVQILNRILKKGPDLSMYHKVHEMVRPDSSKEVSRLIADENWMGNKYTYEPWLQFRVSDIKSNYVNVSGFERKTIPDQYINPLSKDTLLIYFFGGSTMYGYNVSDAETIPSQFVRLYQKKFPNAKSIRVKNFGVTYYYSKQELMLLSKLLFEGHTPDIVVFMDGLNDFYPSRMLYFDKPHFSYAMQQVFDDQLYLKSKRSFIDTSEVFYLDVPSVEPEDYYSHLHDKYLLNITHAESLARTFGSRAYFVCQPVPFFNYPNRSNDPISYKVNYARYDSIYPQLSKVASSKPNMLFLGDMLQNEKGFPFVDHVHYSPAFSENIAERILTFIETRENLK